MVVAQLVRAPDCGSGGRRFETDLPPLRDSFESLFLINQLFPNDKIIFLKEHLETLNYKKGFFLAIIWHFFVRLPSCL